MSITESVTTENQNLWTTSPWPMRIALAYAFLIPVIALNLPKIGGVGAADLLMPIGILTLLLLPLNGRIHAGHIGLASFLVAAALSLLAIQHGKMMVDCTIRWIRLISIIVPFFFGLVIRPNRTQIWRIVKMYGIGGFVAVAIGLFLFVFQIETREGQQRLWMDGGSIIRAGGLIGNSGAFGHMTATWCLMTCLGLMLLSEWKYRYLMIGFVIMTAGYATLGASSRAAMLHLLVGTGCGVMLVRTTIPQRKAVAGLAVAGVLAICLLLSVKTIMPSKKKATSNAAAANMARFIPGMNGSSSEFTSNRAGNWPQFFGMISESPWIGSGYKTGVRLHAESPDNSYLSVFLETGLIGLLCMTLFVVGTLHRLITLYVAGDDVATIMLPICAGQMINCATSDIYTFWITMPVVYMMLGFALQYRGQLMPAEMMASLPTRLPASLSAGVN